MEILLRVVMECELYRVIGWKESIPIFHIILNALFQLRKFIVQRAIDPSFHPIKILFVGTHEAILP